MINNPEEFDVTLEQLRSVKKALDYLRQDLKEAGPGLQAAAPKAYEQRIASLQEEIADWLYWHPNYLARLNRCEREDLLRQSHRAR